MSRGLPRQMEKSAQPFQPAVLTLTIAGLCLRFELKAIDLHTRSSLGRNLPVRAGKVHSLPGSDESGSVIEGKREDGQHSETD